MLSVLSTRSQLFDLLQKMMEGLGKTSLCRWMLNPGDNRRVYAFQDGYFTAVVANLQAGPALW